VTKSLSPLISIFAFRFPFCRNLLALNAALPINSLNALSVYAFLSLNFSTNHATVLSSLFDGMHPQISTLNVHLIPQLHSIILSPSSLYSHPFKTTFHLVSSLAIFACYEISLLERLTLFSRSISSCLSFSASFIFFSWSVKIFTSFKFYCNSSLYYFSFILENTWSARSTKTFATCTIFSLWD